MPQYNCPCYKTCSTNNPIMPTITYVLSNSQAAACGLNTDNDTCCDQGSGQNMDIKKMPFDFQVEPIEPSTYIPRDPKSFEPKYSLREYYMNEIAEGKECGCPGGVGCCYNQNHCDDDEICASLCCVKKKSGKIRNDKKPGFPKPMPTNPFDFNEEKEDNGDDKKKPECKTDADCKDPKKGCFQGHCITKLGKIKKKSDLKEAAKCAFSYECPAGKYCKKKNPNDYYGRCRKFKDQAPGMTTGGGPFVYTDKDSAMSRDDIKTLMQGQIPPGAKVQSNNPKGPLFNKNLRH